MKELPKEPSDFSDLMGLSFKNYYKSFLVSVLFIFLMTVMQGVSIYLGRMHDAMIIHWIVWIVFGLLFFFFAACALRRVHFSLTHGADKEDSKTIAFVAKRFPVMVLTLLILSAFLWVWHYLVYHLGLEWIGHPEIHRTRVSIFMLFFFVVPEIVILGFFFFAIPLGVLEEVSLKRVFGRSMHLIGDKWTWGFASFIGFGIAFMFTYPGSHHAYFFYGYHLLILFDFVIYCLLVPVYFNYLVLLHNDLQLRRVNA